MLIAWCREILSQLWRQQIWECCANGKRGWQALPHTAGDWLTANRRQTLVQSWIWTTSTINMHRLWGLNKYLMMTFCNVQMGSFIDQKSETAVGKFCARVRNGAIRIVGSWIKWIGEKSEKWFYPVTVLSGFSHVDVNLQFPCTQDTTKYHHTRSLIIHSSKWRILIVTIDDDDISCWKAKKGASRVAHAKVERLSMLLFDKLTGINITINQLSESG